MLSKLIKYEAKPMFKFLGFFYSLALFFAILTRIFLNIENSFFMNILGQISSGATIAFIVNIIINNLMRFWVRFTQNMYGDESYLTHTLPVKRKAHYLSKTLTAILTLFCSIIVIAITLFVAYYSKENIEFIKSMLFPVSKIFDISIGGLITLVMLLLFLEFFSVLQCGFCGIILGHRLENNKISFSVLFGFLVYIISQGLVVVSILVASPFNSNIKDIIFKADAITPEGLKIMVIFAVIVYSVVSILEYIINQKLLCKGVNVE